jgi:hypothetical protein
LPIFKINNGPSSQELAQALFDPNTAEPKSVHFSLFKSNPECAFERKFRPLSIMRTDTPGIIEITGFLDQGYPPNSTVTDWRFKIPVSGTFNIDTRTGFLQTDK